MRIATFLLIPLLVCGYQQQDTTPDGESDTIEIKLARAKVIAIQLPVLRRSVEALEAAVPGGADAAPGQSDIDAIFAGYDEEIRFDCSEEVLRSAGPEENKIRRAQCYEMQRLLPILVVIAEYRAKLALLEKLKGEQ